jgi:RimJ/RimL family protein N-acetyltransferase
MTEIPTTFGCLRPFLLGDAAAIARYANNRKIWLNLRDVFPHPYTEDDARSFLGMATAQDPVTTYAITTPDEAIGSIGLILGTDVHRLTAELGYWLAEPFWGKGITTEAVVKFTAFAFERFGLTRVFSHVFAENRASCRVLERAGFELEGKLRCSAIKDGKILDQLLYARVVMPA